MAPKRIKNRRQAGRADPVNEYFREVSRFAAANGARVAAFALGPDGNVRAYGSPSVESVVEDYERRYGGGAVGGAERLEEKSRGELRANGGVVDELTTLMWEVELLEELKKKVAVARGMSGGGSGSGGGGGGGGGGLASISPS